MLHISFEHLLDEIENLPQDQKQIILQRLTSEAEAKNVTPPKNKKRTAGLEEGNIWMSDDFADPLPANDNKLCRCPVNCRYNYMQSGLFRHLRGR